LQIPVPGVAIEGEEIENKFLKSISASNYFNAVPKIMIFIEISFTIAMIITLSLQMTKLNLYWFLYEFVVVSLYIVVSYTIIYLKLKYRHNLTIHRFYLELSSSDMTSLRRANFQTLIYFTYICQYILIGSFYQFYTTYERNYQDGPNDIRTLDLLTILLLYPSNLIMLLGMSESIKRAMRTLARNMHITRKIATASRPLTKFNEDGTGSTEHRSCATEEFLPIT
jgi:hypothetical protein